MPEVFIEKLNEAYIRVTSEPSVAYELRDLFTFEVPGAKYMPTFKSKVWDGKIRLYNVLTGLLYAGLRYKVEQYCQERDYEIKYLADFSLTEFSLKEAKDFIKTLKLPMEPRGYQIKAFLHAVRGNRALLLSPTASGKSLIIYLLTRYYNTKTLIIVPMTGLVEQMIGDFKEYGGEDIASIHTWQSLYKKPESYFNDYRLVIGDEAHGFKAKSLVSIMTKLSKCPFRFGTTGTLDGTETHQMVLEGLFGPLHVVTTTSELMEAKHISSLDVKCILLSYPDQLRKSKKKWDQEDSGSAYQAELDYLISSPDRNRFIKNLALSLEGNTLVLFKFEKHGKYLHTQIQQASLGRSVYYVFGDVETDEREFIRKIVETETDAIIVASVGTFAKGINIKSLHNIIFTSPTKDKITILQAIGRTLRRTEEKTKAVLYDIADDLSWKSYKNFTLKHFHERIKLYEAEQFPFKIYKVALKIDAQKTVPIKQASLWFDDPL